MIHHICFLETLPSTTAAEQDQLLIEIRILLLKLPDIHNLRVGRNLDPADPFSLFLSFDIDSLEKLAFVQRNAIYYQFERQILDAHAKRVIRYSFDMDSGKEPG
ncbi:Dabb family protein [Methylacidimicrobium sp. B4]|uniref:Dabb family protein n=1 Tax=Methylacidimicrobium sp. B4 TaxID=2796139 RepID=UPI001A8D5D05|nr:Dabb family protein [Methylacidimicrobium sp. B4]QSR84744.1 Dabb family protein [Methylacidimicrobium sp. B4]